MTLVYALLAVGFCAVPISITVDFWSDNKGLPPLGYTRTRRRQQELERLTAPLPEARTSLLPTDWPQPVTPLDLPGIGHTAELAAVQLSSRVFAPEPAPVVVELVVLEGRHRVGVAPGTQAQRARWNSPTGQFWAIVEDLDLDEPCTHCAAPEDGEPAHAGCPGCACPCGLAVGV